MMYRSIRTSRQAFHGKLDRYLRKQEELHQLGLIMDQLREDHPGMSLRDVYQVIQPQCMGRDNFERYFQVLGYGVRVRRSFRRTTNSNGVIRFPNKIEGRTPERIDQIWVSDITYFQIKERFYYLTFIMDLFSRRIVGYSSSFTLMTEYTTIPALKSALRTRKSEQIPELILHSDGGGQYYSKRFRQLTQDAKIINSMGRSVFENPHAERVNGIIKNNYLVYYAPKNEKELRIMLRKAVRMYNEQKPHGALNKMSPIQFENRLKPVNAI